MPPDFDPFKVEGITTEEPKKDDPVKTEPAGPSLEDLLADERKSREEAEARFDKQSAIYEARLEQFGTFLKDSYGTKLDQQVDPVPDVTDAEFDKSPSKATRDTVQREMKEQLGKVNEYYAGVIGNLANQTFEVQLGALEKERFWPYVKEDVEKFFEDNPSAKLSRAAAKTIYDQYVGSGISGGDLLRREEEDRVKREQNELITMPGQPARRAPVPSDGQRIPAPRVPAASTSGAPRMTQEEAEVFEIYKNAGVFENEKDWAEWKITLGYHERESIPMDLQETK